jgi:hypothetical protein
MPIASFDQWIAATKQNLTIAKTVVKTTVANSWFSLLDQDGNPGKASALGVGNTANGIVPTDANQGFPRIAFTSGNTYISNVFYFNSASCRLALFDRLFAAGAYSFNSNVSLTGQPSFSSRIPNADYTGLQIWLEQVTLGTGTQSVAVTYTDQSGNAGHTTGTVVAPASAFASGRMFQLPLAPGDSGVQKIESVVGSVATGGTFNILVLRPLWSGRVPFNNSGDAHGPDRTGMPQIFNDSALQPLIFADSTSGGLPDFIITIANG